MPYVHKLIFLVFYLGMIAGPAIAAGPIAGFAGTPTSGNAPLSVTFTDTSTGFPTGWAWYFGDEDYTGTSWTEMNASAPWYGRFGHASVALPDGSIVLMGGGGGYKNDVWRSTDKGITWTQQNASAGWTGREFHTSVALPDGSIVLMGGYNGAYFNDVWRSNDQGVTWIRQTAQAGWQARYGLTSVVLPDGRIAVMGGMYYNSGTRYARDLWISTDQGLAWSQQTYPPGELWTPRRYHSSVALPDGSIVIMGGESSGYLDDVVRLVEQGTTWSVRKYQLPLGQGRYHHSSVPLPDGSIVLMGGQIPSAIKNDVWRFATGNPAQHPVHIYKSAGIYDVTLQVFDGSGYSSSNRDGYITVSPEIPSPTVIGITPDTGLNTGIISITNLSGTSFDTINAPSVRLNRTGTADVLADEVTTLSSSRITCTFDLTNKVTGQWNVVVSNPDGKTGILENGFTLTQPPPTAGFTGSPTLGNTPLSVSFTDCSAGSPTDWYWDFGDGGSSIDQNPTNTYTNPGSYTVTLKVENTGGSDTMTKTTYISVLGPPPGIFSITPNTSVNTTTVCITNLAGTNFNTTCTPSVRLNRTGNADIVATMVNTPSAAQITCTFDLTGRPAGTWNAVVTNPDGQVGILGDGFTVMQPPPTAGFTGSPTSGKTPLLIFYNDTSTGSPTGWRWTFGDGGTSTDQNPSHTYTVAGTYTVKLTVQNAGGSDTMTRTGYIAVSAARPPVITSFSPASIIHGKTVNVAIIGNYFQTGATAKLVQGATTIPVTIKTLTPPSKIAGAVTVPSSARGKWSIVINNPDGGTCTRANAITIT